MKPESRLYLLIFLSVLGIILGGCARPRDLSIPSPKPPPGYAASRPCALDVELRAAARRELAAALDSSDPAQRGPAIETLQDVDGVAAGDRIVAALNDSDAAVRFAALMASGRLRLQAARARAEVLLEDASPSVHVAALFALHRLGEVGNSRQFETLAFDPLWQVRANVAMALGMLDEPTALRVLKPLAKDKEPQVRLQALEAMWRLGDSDALAPLVMATISGHPDDRMIALLALAARRDRRVIQHLRGALTDDYAEVALVAARACGMLGADDGYGVAQTGTASKDPRQRALAAWAFGAIGRRDAQPILADLLRDEDSAVRLAAARAILRLE